MSSRENVRSTRNRSRASDQNDFLPRDLLTEAVRAMGGVACRLNADDLTFSFVEPNVVSVTGIGADAWNKPDFWDVHLHPDDKSAVEDARRAARSGKRHVTLACRVDGGNGQVPIRLFARKLPRQSQTSRPQLCGCLITMGSSPAVANDVAAEADSANEAALWQARQDLIRTAQLAVAGELVGAITHDLRQPMTAMRVNLEVALELLHRATPDVPGAVAALADANTDGGILTDSVQVLQDLVARRTPKVGSVPFGQLLDDVAKLLQTEASARQVKLRVRRPADLPQVRGDPMMLREAVLSLMLDAVENASPDASGTPVVVSASASDDARVELTVAHQRRPDVTVDDAWALTVARSVADAHSATMLVDVNPTAGVTVRTSWPALRDDVVYRD